MNIKHNSKKNYNAIICSDHLNALGIVISLNKIGFKGRCFCISVGIKDNCITKYYPRLCRTLNITKKDAENLPLWIEKKFPLCDNTNFVFFTNEQFHYQFKRKYKNKPPLNLKYKLGSINNIDIICDKSKLYHYISTKGFIDTPITIPSSKNPFDVFGPSFFLRIKKSWDGIKELPRGIIITSENDFIETIKFLEQKNISKSEYVYQELLDTTPKNNISIVGWHDKNFKKYFTTRPLYRINSGAALAIEFCKPFSNSIEITQSILEDLDYNGPFEIEYIRNPKDKKLKIIEINPRFWLQHSLIEENYDHILIRKYLNQEIDNFNNFNINKNSWVSTIQVIPLFLRKNFGVLKYINSESIYYPSWNVAIRYLLFKKFKKIRKSN